MSQSRPSIDTGLGGAGTVMSNDSRESAAANAGEKARRPDTTAAAMMFVMRKRQFYRSDVPAGTLPRE
jgi:hypothetical protein